MLHLDEPVRDAEEVRLGGSDASASQDDVAGAGPADQRGETVAAAATGDDAQAGLRETDYGVGGKNTEVSCESEFKATAEGN